MTAPRKKRAVAKPRTTTKKRAPAKPAPKRRATTVVAALKRELEQIRSRDEALADSPLAAAALVLARQLDSSKTSATAKSSCARSLRELLDRLRDLAPATDTNDRLDDLNARRASRRGSTAA